MHNSPFVQLKAADGLNVPYKGYIAGDMRVMNLLITDCVVFVMKDTHPPPPHLCPKSPVCYFFRGGGGLTK